MSGISDRIALRSRHRAIIQGFGTATRPRAAGLQALRAGARATASVRMSIPDYFDKSMGGFGSGKRPAHEPRQLVERCFILDAWELGGMSIVPGREGSVELQCLLAAWDLLAAYMVRNAGSGLVWTLYVPVHGGTSVQHIPLELVRLVSGGHRVYMRCPGRDPNEGCDRRVTKLYLPLFGQPTFGCRRCHRLAYRSTRERADPLWQRRALGEARASGMLRPAAG